MNPQDLGGGGLPFDDFEDEDDEFDLEAPGRDGMFDDYDDYDDEFDEEDPVEEQKGAFQTMRNRYGVGDEERSWLLGEGSSNDPRSEVMSPELDDELIDEGARQQMKEELRNMLLVRAKDRASASDKFFDHARKMTGADEQMYDLPAGEGDYE